MSKKAKAIYWLSFCDPKRPEGEKFLGAAMVEVYDAGDERANLARAINAAWRNNCNPGGEVQSCRLPDEELWPGQHALVRRNLYRLMDRAEAEHFAERPQ